MVGIYVQKASFAFALQLNCKSLMGGNGLTCLCTLTILAQCPTQKSRKCVWNSFMWAFIKYIYKIHKTKCFIILAGKVLT